MNPAPKAVAAEATGAHRLEQVAAEGPWGGPVFRYHGAEIRCLRGGHVCGLLMEAHPLHGATFGVPGTITPLIDIWLDRGRLPEYLRVVPGRRSLRLGEGRLFILFLSFAFCSYGARRSSRT